MSELITAVIKSVELYHRRNTTIQLDTDNGSERKDQNAAVVVWVHAVDGSGRSHRIWLTSLNRFCHRGEIDQHVAQARALIGDITGIEVIIEYSPSGDFGRVVDGLDGVGIKNSDIFWNGQVRLGTPMAKVTNCSRCGNIIPRRTECLYFQTFSMDDTQHSETRRFRYTFWQCPECQLQTQVLFPKPFGLITKKGVVKLWSGMLGKDLKLLSA